MEPRLPFDVEPAEITPEMVPSPRVRRRLRSHQEARRQRRTILTYSLLGASAVLMIHALVGESGYLATIRAERDYQAVTGELQALDAENAALVERIRRLNSDPTAVEEAARRELGFIRPGETLVVIRDARPAPPAPRR